MKKIFISHSSFDKDVAELLVDFMKFGLGVNEASIFCSSIDGHDIPVGVNFNDYILEQLREADGCIVISIISNHYYNSKYCLYELGVAWGLGDGKNIIPFLVKEMKYGNLQDFISHTQAIDGLKKKDINKLSDLIRNDESILKSRISTTQFDNYREKFIVNLGRITLENRDRKNSVSTNSKLKYKLVAFDFDGTILQGKKFKHSWKAIWEYLHYNDSERKRLHEKHRNNPKNYSFQDWCDECVEYFIKRGFQITDIEKIIKNKKLKTATGFDELINVIHKLGIKIIIISGGIDTFVTSTISENTMQLIDEIYINKFRFDKDGNLASVEAYQDSASDSAGKVKVLEEYCMKNNLSLSEVVYVGDETNDIDIMTNVGKAIIYPGHTASRFNKQMEGFKVIYEENIINILPEVLWVL